MNYAEIPIENSNIKGTRQMSCQTRKKLWNCRRIRAFIALVPFH